MFSNNKTNQLFVLLLVCGVLLSGGCQSTAPQIGGTTNYDPSQHATVLDDCHKQHGKYIYITIVSKENRDGTDEIVGHQCFPSSKETYEKLVATGAEFEIYKDGVRQ